MNRRLRAVALVCAIALMLAASSRGQETSTPVASAPSSSLTPEASASTVPHLIKFSGVINPQINPQITQITQITQNETGKAGPSTVIGVTFSLYELREGGTPLWVESQKVALDEQGRYTVLLGATSPNGLPLDLFTSGKALWLGVQPQLAGVGEQPRTLLVAVPYALKAVDADTLGGKPVSAFAMNDSQTGLSTEGGTQSSTSGTATQAGGAVSPPAGSGLPGYIPRWITSTLLGDSTIFESSGKVGIGNTTPGATLDVSGNAVVRGNVGLGNTPLGSKLSSESIPFSVYNNSTDKQLQFHVNSKGTSSRLNGVSVDSNLQVPHINLAVSNGANNNVAIGDAGYVRLTGPTAAFNITGFANGVDGRELTVQNSTIYAMTIRNLVGSSSGNQIATFSGADVVLPAGVGATATFMYSATDHVWFLRSYQPATGADITQGAINVLNGVVGIGTATPDSSVREEIAGGSQLFVPAFTAGANNGPLYHFAHVISYFWTAGPGPYGTVEIILPHVGTTMMAPSQRSMRIVGFSWPWGRWEIQIAGWMNFYQSSSDSCANATTWCGANATITGAFPYPYVRLAYDTSLSRFVVLLGTTSTAWDSLFYEVTDLDVVLAGEGSGWSTAVLTSESSITNPVTLYSTTPYLAVGRAPISGGTGVASGLGRGPLEGAGTVPGSPPFSNGMDPSVNFEVFGGSSLAIPASATGTTPIYHYKDLISYSPFWTTQTVTGEIEIALPNPPSGGGIISMTIDGEGDGNVWQVKVGGHPGSPGAVGTWETTPNPPSVMISGSPPFTSARLGYDTALSKYVVLLGTLATGWTWPTIEVSDFAQGVGGGPAHGAGWSIALLTSEAKLANIVTPGYVNFTGVTAAVSNCGSLSGSAGCAQINVSGTLHYIPYW